MPEKPELKPHVREHLDKRDVDHTELPDEVIVVLNDFSESELDALARVGATMEETNVDVTVRAAMVH